MKRIYLLPLLAGLFVGCHHAPDADDSLTYDLTGRYTLSTTITAAHPISLYTRNGLVSNPAVLTRFLAHHFYYSTDVFSATDVAFVGGYTTTLTFRAGNRATLLTASPTSTDSTHLEVTNREASSFLLQRLDSITVAVPTPPLCPHADGLLPFLVTRVGGRKCRPVPTTTGYSQQCRIRPLWVVGVRGSQLYVPYFSWLLADGQCDPVISGDWNTFNPSVLGRLAASDTLAIQEREIALHR